MINFPVDFVLPYVNCLSQKWQNTYIDFCKKNGYADRVKNFNPERYRDWGFFRYAFRGIEYNLPFINKIYLILQDEDQIPQWMKTDKIQIVYHKDFIPSEYLPTYNSTTIEMFLDKIPGLSEHFIYSNDDIYPLLKMQAEHFFTEDGKVKIGFRERVLSGYGQFDLVCCRCYNEVQLLTKFRDTTPQYLTPYHEFTPMIKSHLTKVNELFGDRIEKGISAFREPKNHNQYIYSYIDYKKKNINTLSFYILFKQFIFITSTISTANFFPFNILFARNTTSHLSNSIL